MGPPRNAEGELERGERNEQKFFELAERFRSANDPEEIHRLGDQLGRLVFGV